MKAHPESIGTRLKILILVLIPVIIFSCAAVSADSDVPVPEGGEAERISPYQIEDILYNSLFALGIGWFEEARPESKEMIAVTFYDLAWKYWIYTVHLGSDRNRIVEARLPAILRSTNGLVFEEFLESPMSPSPPEDGEVFQPIHYRIRNREGELRSFSITTPEQLENVIQAFRDYLKELDRRYEEKFHPSLKGEKDQ